MKSQSAFSLTELLAVVALTVCLAGLLLAAVGQSREAADRAVAISQMRQIGVGVMHFTADSQGRLPGPLKAGQKALYDPGKADSLATVLGPYLGVTSLEEKQVLDVFLPPACVAALPGQPRGDIHPYVLNISRSVADQPPQFPWGSDAPGRAEPAMNLAAVDGALWALADADQKNPQVIDQPWKNKTPADRVHGKERLAWFFDGSVQNVSEEVLKKPPGGGGGPPPSPPPPRR